MKLSFAFASVAVAFSLMACMASEESSDTASDEVRAADAAVCKKAGPPPLNVFCPAVYDPVCGCDGKTYGNACEASRVVTSYTPDACPAPATDAGVACEKPHPLPGLACPAVYDPVCGCNGKTYGNSCEAGREVTSFTPDACSSPPSPPPTGPDVGFACKRPSPKKNVVCPAVYDPVCGCDGKTYGNSCEAGRVVTSYTPDAC